jgi:hypothetical protein
MCLGYSGVFVYLVYYSGRYILSSDVFFRMTQSDGLIADVFVVTSIRHVLSMHGERIFGREKRQCASFSSM